MDASPHNLHLACKHQSASRHRHAEDQCLGNSLDRLRQQHTHSAFDAIALLHCTKCIALSSSASEEPLSCVMQLSEIVQACANYSSEAARLQHADKQGVQQLFDEFSSELAPALQKAA